jgi:ATP-dependent helicase/nuclease subunit A
MGINIYKASAGSGKTYTLAYKYVRLLFDSKNEHPHRNTLAVTFTNKATDEMKSRIVNELYKLSTDAADSYMEKLMKDTKLSNNEIKEKAQKFLIDILHNYSDFNISTIDRFFQQIVRAFTREIGYYGNFGLELDTDPILEQAIGNMLFDLDKKENKGTFDSIQQIIKSKIDDGKSWRIDKDLSELGGELFKEKYLQNSAELEDKLGTEFNNFCTAIDKIIRDYEKKMKDLCAEACRIMKANGLTSNDFPYTTSSFAHCFEFEYLKGKNFELTGRFKTNGENDSVDKGWYTKGSPKTNDIIKAFDDGLGRIVVEMCEISENDYERYLSAKLVKEKLPVLGVLTVISKYIKKYCDEKNTMLISSTNDFLNRIIEGSDTPFVYEKAGVFLEHFMLDEFQDTSTMQWKNFKPLLKNSVAGGHDNLIVGDVKQCIYRWRNSDWELLRNGVNSDFDDCEPIPLKENWRSAKNIVRFNNLFFSKIGSRMDENLLPEGGTERNKIDEIYADVEQVPKKDFDGYVQLQFIKKSENDAKNADSGEEGDGDSLGTDFCEVALEKTNEIVGALLKKGYQERQITVLVRKNDEAAKVARSLLENGYPVVSNEALQIAASPCVQLLTGILRFFVDPNNEINRFLVEQRSGAKFDPYEKKNWEDIEPEMEWLKRVFGAEKAEKINSLKNKPLFQLVEALIQLFDLAKDANSRVFLQAFQDEIFSFSNKSEADINGFLDYWDECSDKRFLAASETQNAIRIMTIHKSKGLEFDAVIIPFCKFEFKPQNANKTILWCKTEGKDEPFCKLPILPISYKSDVEKSIFSKDYLEEKTNNCIDALNMAYVAFTRPKKSLFIIAEQIVKPKRDDSVPDKRTKIKGDVKKEQIVKPKRSDSVLKSVANMVEDYFDKGKFGDLKVAKREDGDGTKIVEIGELSPLSEKESEGGNDLPLTYDTVPVNDRLRLRYKPDDDSESAQKRLEGLLMHDILGQIATVADVDKVLQQFELDGRLTKEKSAETAERLRKLLSGEKPKDWFSDRYKVQNETEIITPQGKIYRPDRVMIDENAHRVVVVDYKFGENREPRYKWQVANYMQLIAQMGYKTEGYIWYTTLGKIEEVR